MSHLNAVALTTTAGVALVAGASVVVGMRRARQRQSADDLLVAARGASRWSNGAAIGSENISAAAFLGLAGIAVAFGADALWFPIGATAGYVVILALIVAPLRRSGAYTLSDFAEWRLRSITIRRLVTFFVTFTGIAYVLPQLHAAGLILRLLTGAPLWAGAGLVVVVILLVTVPGGMRSTTGMQAWQFWLKLAVVAIAALALAFAWRADEQPRDGPGDVPRFRETTDVAIARPVAFQVVAATDVVVTGRLDGRRLEDDPVRLAPGVHRAGPRTSISFPAGAQVPHRAGMPVLTGQEWAERNAGQGWHGQSLYRTLAILLAAAMGAMGLPHLLVRFYASRDGPAARRTVPVVLFLVSAFFLLTPVLGALSRVYVPDVLVTGQLDEALLLLPGRALGGLPGDLLTGVVAAGAFAAFLATSSGILVAVGGTWSTCFLGGGVAGFRTAVAAFAGVVAALALVTDPLGAPRFVMVAFVVSASTVAPLLVLGVWWRRLSKVGAAAGMIIGGGVSAGAALAGFLWPIKGWAGTLLAGPALASVPLAFATMVVISLLTPGQVPGGTGRLLARMHLPERAAGRSAMARHRSSI